MPTILITGATGTIGGEVTRQLVAAGHRPRILVRSAAKAKPFAGAAEIMEGDLGDADAAAAALKGVDRMFLLASGPELPRLEEVAVTAAQRAKIAHIVKLSVAGADEHGLVLGQWHRQSEQRILATGIPHTFLRPVNFMSNALTWAASIKAQSAIVDASGDGKVAYIDPADIAAVAVAALTRPETHAKREYPLTGPEALSAAEMAAIIGNVIGRPVRHVDLPPAQLQAGLRQSGLPDQLVAAYLELYAVMRAGRLDFVDDTVERLLGRKAATFASFVERHAASFQ